MTGQAGRGEPPRSPAAGTRAGWRRARGRLRRRAQPAACRARRPRRCEVENAGSSPRRALNRHLPHGPQPPGGASPSMPTWAGPAAGPGRATPTPGRLLGLGTPARPGEAGARGGRADPPTHSAPRSRREDSAHWQPGRALRMGRPEANRCPWAALPLPLPLALAKGECWSSPGPGAASRRAALTAARRRACPPSVFGASPSTSKVRRFCPRRRFALNN